MHTYFKPHQKPRRSPRRARPAFDVVMFESAFDVLVNEANFPPFLARNILNWRASRGLSLHVARVLS